MSDQPGRVYSAGEPPAPEDMVRANPAIPDRVNPPSEGRVQSVEKGPYPLIAEREDCPACTSSSRSGCPICHGRGYVDPPLVCAYCFARRWNDTTVQWLPLRGLYREPYCANTCATWVMTGRSEGADVWAALVDLPERGDLR